MQRDMDLIRRIVLELNKPDVQRLDRLEGVEQELFNYNANLLVEAGLAKAAVLENGPRVSKILLWRLTWQGHDFADSVADDTLWKRAVEQVIQPGASWSFSVLTDWLKAQVIAQLPGL